jgi:predicted DNA-binding protein with PD1-like motif
MGTLTDGALLHDALIEAANAHNIQTATVEMLGGLHEVELTAYDFVTQTRIPPRVVTRAMEIIAGHGTLALLDGKPHVHLHMALAYRDEASPTGITVIGGHVARGVAYAVEFTLTAYDGAPVHRGLHAGTGLNLWDLPPLTSP